MTIWSDRDFIVLEFLHQHPPRHEMLQTNWVSKEPHSQLDPLTEQAVHLSIETLAEEGLVQYSSDSWEMGGGVWWSGLQVTGSGLQTLGQWPIFDALESPDRLGTLLEALANQAASDEEEANLRSAATTVRARSAELLKAAVAGAANALIRSQLGL